MKGTVPRRGHSSAARSQRQSARFSVFALFGKKAGKKLSARVSPLAEEKTSTERKANSQMQQKMANMDEVEDMETEMSPERK